MDIKKILEQRTRLEDRIRELGGTIPIKWNWDNGTLRNLQLLELVEELEMYKYKTTRGENNA